MTVLAGYRVRGRVQGVGFRWWARQTACTIGLRGQVRNCPDGCVEVVAQGTRDQLERFERALAEGPPASRVEALDHFDPTDEPSSASFEIAL